MKTKQPAICILRHGYYPEDPRVYKEAQCLIEKGWSLDIICIRKPGQKLIEAEQNGRIYRLPIIHKRDSLIRYFIEYGLSISAMFVLVTVLYFSRRYSCIQVNTLPDALVFSTIIAKLRGAKIVLDMHEPFPELMDTKYGLQRLAFLKKVVTIIEQLAIKFADQVITVNDALRKRYIQRGASGEKIGVVRNVPDESIISEVKIKKSGKKFILLTHGTIEERYGHETLINALPLIREQIDCLHCYIVGDGEEYLEKMKALSNSLRCSDFISFTGYVPFSQIKKFIMRADLGLVPFLPSPFADLCQPNKLFEYVALKKPVVISRLAAIEESFDDSSVMFYKPGESDDLARCVIDLYHNPEKCRILAENAYRVYEDLKWDKTKNIYLQEIEKVLNNYECKQN